MSQLGDDGTEFDQRYALTHLGQPIGLVEYACRLARGESSHVILLNDWDPETPGKLSILQLDLNEVFNEFVLPNRPGQNKLHYVPQCDTEEIFRFFK